MASNTIKLDASYSVSDLLRDYFGQPGVRLTDSHRPGKRIPIVWSEAEAERFRAMADTAYRDTVYGGTE